MPELTPDLRAQISRAADILKHGGVVAYPTDTVYGLGAAMHQSTAIKRIFTIKERPERMALPLLLSDISQIPLITQTFPAAARRLAEAFFPGALTIILPKSAAVPDAVTAGAATVAFRVPDHPAALALIRDVGTPIVGTSANRSGQPSALTANEVKMQIGGKIDMIVDGGKCPGGIESTIIDLSGASPVIRRQGAISLVDIRQILPETVTV